MKRTSLVVVAALAGIACSQAPAGGMHPGARVSHTFPNDQAAFDYLLGKGLQGFQAAGVVGNLDQESGVDPNSHQNGGGPGRGIAQWETGGRWDSNANDNVLAYAQQQGRSATDLSLQLDFLWYELTSFSNYGLGDLQGTTNVTDATVVFQNEFEGCSACDQSTRIGYAQQVLAAYGGDSAGSPPSPPPPSGSSGGGGGSSGGGGGGGGPGDACANVPDGGYCGNDPSGPGGDPNTLFWCMGGATTSSTPCANGCTINPGQQDDSCNQAPAPPPPPPSGGVDACANVPDGGYCGNDPDGPGGDPNTLYWCQGGVTTSTVPCANGCTINPGQQDDSCN